MDSRTEALSHGSPARWHVRLNEAGRLSLHCMLEHPADRDTLLAQPAHVSSMFSLWSSLHTLTNWLESHGGCCTVQGLCSNLFHICELYRLQGVNQKLLLFGRTMYQCCRQHCRHCEFVAHNSVGKANFRFLPVFSTFPWLLKSGIFPPVYFL